MKNKTINPLCIFLLALSLTLLLIVGVLGRELYHAKARNENQYQISFDAVEQIDNYFEEVFAYS